MTGFHNNSLPLLRASKERMFYIMTLSLLPQSKKYAKGKTLGRTVNLSATVSSQNSSFQCYILAKLVYNKYHKM